MTSDTIVSEVVSQTPVRDLAAFWIEKGSLIAGMPVVAQAIVRRHPTTGLTSDHEVDFIVYSGNEGTKIVGCCESFPVDKYGSAWIVPCSSEQWQRMFFNTCLMFGVAKEICEKAGVLLERWRR